METEIMQSVLTEVLEELKEVKQQQEKIQKNLLTLTEKVDGFEQKLSAIKVTPPAVNLTPVITTILQGLDKIKDTIVSQPKSITRQVRILLFPEYGAGEYYGLIFGRLLMCIFFIFIACFLFMLGKEYIYEYLWKIRNDKKDLTYISSI